MLKVNGFIISNITKLAKFLWSNPEYIPQVSDDMLCMAVQNEPMLISKCIQTRELVKVALLSNALSTYHCVDYSLLEYEDYEQFPTSVLYSLDEIPVDYQKVLVTVSISNLRYIKHVDHEVVRIAMNKDSLKTIINLRNTSSTNEVLYIMAIGSDSYSSFGTRWWWDMFYDKFVI